MHIIIPMAGVGQRFINAGYSEPKPLIKINGKAIVEHACDMFPNETKFTFICNAKHLAETNMRGELLKIRPDSNIIEIPNHTYGPVYTVLQISDLIDDDEEVIVNYCDFGVYWDYEDFLKHTRERDADGVVVSYKKFHPHMFSGTNYALSTDTEQWLDEIKEKEPIDKAMEKYVSNGTYYFKRGGDLKKYSQALMDRNITYNDEYYVSLIYNLLVEDNLKVSIYDIPHMLQWGVPEEVEDYNYWSDYFEKRITEEKNFEASTNSIAILSLIDKNLEFEKVGYKEYTKAKPFIEIGGKPMITQAFNSLPNSEEKRFLILEEHLNNESLMELFKQEFPKAKVITLDNIKDLSFMENEVENSIVIGEYDKSIEYDLEKYKALTADRKIDIVAFTNDGKSIGSFYFKNLEIFKEVVEILKEEDVLVILSEKYMLELLEVDYFISWEKPFNYESYLYWQSFFHKVEWHPYLLEKDSMVKRESIEILDKTFRSFEQEYR